jgi:toxin HigB-1
MSPANREKIAPTPESGITCNVTRDGATWERWERLEIINLKGKDTENLFADRRVPKFNDIERVARRKLSYLNQAKVLQDLRVPPGNLEALLGDRKGQYSIRINDQWRICCKWNDGDVEDVSVMIHARRLLREETARLRHLDHLEN